MNRPQEDKSPNYTCPKCGPVAAPVTDSRPTELMGRVTVRRRRECPTCDHRETTYEVRLGDARDDMRKLVARMVHRLVDELVQEMPE